MAKPTSRWDCQKCGAQHASYIGRCPNCQEWGSLVEVVVPPDPPAGRGRPRAASNSLVASGGAARPLRSVEGLEHKRLNTGIGEVNRVLGGGLVPGSVVLVGGEPGAGKSTLLLSAAQGLAKRGERVVYASGEESAEQIKMRADRLGDMPESLLILNETDLDSVLAELTAANPTVCIVDSIQTLMTADLTGGAGSVGQLRECAHRLTQWAKSSGVAVFIVGHVTKEGALAGPRVLEHVVDVVLYLEGERFQQHRLLRAVKNRFGSTNEIGLFVMESEGMVEVTNPSEMLLAGASEGFGSVITAAVEGTRPLLVEIQALTTLTNAASPRRVVSGLDYGRAGLVMAVLGKHLGFRVLNEDVFLNLTGGLRCQEPGVDLAVLCALASSERERPIPKDTLVFGEVGLCGEVRPVPHAERRLAEAQRLGFRRAILPAASRLRGAFGIELARVATAREALAALDLERRTRPGRIAPDEE